MTRTSQGVTTATSPLLHLQRASVVLGSSLVLSGVDLRVEAGESVTLLGANGSGKSTMMRACLGLVPLSQGRAELFGVDLRCRRQVPWERVGYVPQRVGAASGVPATALEVVRSGLLGLRRPFADRGRQASARALEALEAVGLAHRAQDHVQVFSGGQAQRVLIARALVRRPKLLLLDEPLAGIDRRSQQTLATILQQLRAQGLTLVTVLHELGALAEVVDRAVLLDQGHVLMDGPSKDVVTEQHRRALDESLGCHHPDLAPHRVPHHAPTLSPRPHLQED